MAKGITLQEMDKEMADRLVIKDGAGRAKVAAPSVADDIALKSTVDNAVGTLSSLLTTDKSNVVKAINELFTNVSNGKDAVAAAITGKGVPASGSDTIAQLAAKIGQIVTGKKFASGVKYEPNLPTGYELVVTGLDFNPSVVFVSCISTNPNTAYSTFMLFLVSQEYSRSAYPLTGLRVIYDDSFSALRGDTGSVGVGGFSAKFGLSSYPTYGYNVTWYAYE
ncbi:hypothetical protein [Paenibacillus lutimineralis]|uniref:Tail fiber protein n=1 Tax=Paenibacillus lutimineralis TaxID=2707005 RepID=A0A3Q9I9J9_9BACL|nr:hypothetical protein [Paenibacillus lutimineralis]AZS14247.1 hypothetical protein EI981_07085 [Paenibacillus lutimineralis]